MDDKKIVDRQIKVIYVLTRTPSANPPNSTALCSQENSHAV